MYRAACQVITRIGEAASPAGLGGFSPATFTALVRAALLDDDSRPRSAWNHSAALREEAAGGVDGEALAWLTAHPSAEEWLGALKGRQRGV